MAAYGEVPKRMYERIENEEIKSRIADFSWMRPGSSAAKAFREKLNKVVLEHYRKEVSFFLFFINIIKGK